MEQIPNDEYENYGHGDYQEQTEEDYQPNDEYENILMDMRQRVKQIKSKLKGDNPKSK